MLPKAGVIRFPAAILSGTCSRFPAFSLTPAAGLLAARCFLATCQAEKHKSAAVRLHLSVAKREDTQRLQPAMISRRRLGRLQGSSRWDGKVSVSIGQPAALQAPAGWTEDSPHYASPDGDWQAKLVPISGPTTPEHAGPHAGEMEKGEDRLEWGGADLVKMKTW